jgi:thiamine-phosphate pyrophosphorylase
LRVVEDVVRFVFNDARLSQRLKNIRHTLSGATAAAENQAIFFRDTPGDVGTSIKTGRELSRQNLAELLTSNCKRVGEALRSIEECLKVSGAIENGPSVASAVERARYDFYEIERLLALRIRPAAQRLIDRPMRLYVVLSESVCRLDWMTSAKQAIAGGADVLQLREKNLDGGEFLRRAKALASLCRDHNVLFVVNDRADIAVLSDADGVHVGQTDLPLAEVRKMVGDKLVGVSTHEIAYATAAQDGGADYIGVGPVFRSSTKPREIDPGLPYAREVAQQITIPSVAIAGITIDNVHQVLATGLKGVAVSSAVLSTENVESATRALRERMELG